MGGAKRMMEEAERQQGAAAEILLKVGIFGCCPVHEDILLSGDIGVDLTPAYKYGNYHWEKYQEVFETPRQMTDTIKEVAEGYELAAEECPICANNAASD